MFRVFFSYSIITVFALYVSACAPGTRVATVGYEFPQEANQLSASIGNNLNVGPSPTPSPTGTVLKKASSLSDINCYTINVLGPGIGSSSPSSPPFFDPGNYCSSYPGILTPIFSRSSGGGGELVVPTGFSRTFQLIGLTTADGSCPGGTISDLMNSGNWSSVVHGAYLLDSVTVDLQGDASVDLSPKFDSSKDLEACHGRVNHYGNMPTVGGGSMGNGLSTLGYAGATNFVSAESATYFTAVDSDFGGGYGSRLFAITHNPADANAGLLELSDPSIYNIDLVSESDGSIYALGTFDFAMLGYPDKYGVFTLPQPFDPMTFSGLSATCSADISDNISPYPGTGGQSLPVVKFNNTAYFMGSQGNPTNIQLYQCSASSLIAAPSFTLDGTNPPNFYEISDLAVSSKAILFRARSTGGVSPNYPRLYAYFYESTAPSWKLVDLSNTALLRTTGNGPEVSELVVIDPEFTGNIPSPNTITQAYFTAIGTNGNRQTYHVSWRNAGTTCVVTSETCLQINVVNQAQAAYTNSGFNTSTPPFFTNFRKIAAAQFGGRQYLYGFGDLDPSTSNSSTQPEEFFITDSLDMSTETGNNGAPFTGSPNAWNHDASIASNFINPAFAPDEFFQARYESSGPTKSPWMFFTGTAANGNKRVYYFPISNSTSVSVYAMPQEFAAISKIDTIPSALYPGIDYVLVSGIDIYGNFENYLLTRDNTSPVFTIRPIEVDQGPVTDLSVFKVGTQEYVTYPAYFTEAGAVGVFLKPIDQLPADSTQFRPFFWY